MQLNQQKTESSAGQSGNTREDVQENKKDYDKVLTWDQYQVRGRRIKDRIDANPVRDKIVKLRGQLIPMDRTIESANIRDGYDLDGHDRTHRFKKDSIEEWLPFKEMGISYDLNFVAMLWWTKKPASRGPADYPPNVNKSYYNAKQGIIIMALMCAKHDGWPTVSTMAPERNYASEITWQSWKMIAGNSSTNLRIVIQENIQNEGTLKVIKEAYSKQKPSLGKSQYGDFSMDGNEQQREAFLALLGTDNARPIEYMLIDHFVEVGRKKIQKIRVFPYKGFGGEDSWHMVLEIRPWPLRMDVWMRIAQRRF